MNTRAILPGCDPKCRGCAHREFTAAESQAQKQHWLASRLAPWADRLDEVRVVAEEARLGYRDRVLLSAQWDPNTGWRIGTRTRDDEVISTLHCPVQSARVRKALAALIPALPPASDFPLAFFVQNGAQITLVLKCSRVRDTRWCDDALTKQLTKAGVEGLWLHLFPSAGRQLFAKGGWRLLFGKARSMDALGLVYGPAAFSQLIPELYVDSLDQASAFLAPGPDDAVFDLYCGRGATLARWKQRGTRAVVGVEAGGEAVECAQVNVPDVTVLRGLCAQRLPQLTRFLDVPGLRLAYVNPPRTGLEPEVLRWLVEVARPARLAYLSCSAGTLYRDLQTLADAEYEVVRLTPYDFFPRTQHVETLALLALRMGREAQASTAAR